MHAEHWLSMVWTGLVQCTCTFLPSALNLHGLILISGTDLKLEVTQYAKFALVLQDPGVKHAQAYIIHQSGKGIVI